MRPYLKGGASEKTTFYNEIILKTTLYKEIILKMFSLKKAGSEKLKSILKMQKKPNISV